MENYNNDWNVLDKMNCVEKKWETQLFVEALFCGIVALLYAKNCTLSIIAVKKGLNDIFVFMSLDYRPAGNVDKSSCYALTHAHNMLNLKNWKCDAFSDKVWNIMSKKNHL